MKDATLAQGNQVLNLILQKQIPSEQLQRLMGSGLFSDLLEANLENGIDRDAFRKLIGLKPLNAYTLMVNYDLSVEKAVKAGKYDRTNSDITSSHFPSAETGRKEVSIELVHFGRSMETEDVLRELDKMGLRPATLKEILALGERFPDLQREFPIIGLGSVWQTPLANRYCAYLRRSGSGRDLSLSWIDSGWYDGCRFAAVRK